MRAFDLFSTLACDVAARKTDLWETAISLHTHTHTLTVISQLNTGSIFNLCLICSRYARLAQRVSEHIRRRHTQARTILSRWFDYFNYFVFLLIRIEWAIESLRNYFLQCIPAYMWHCREYYTTYLTWPKIYNFILVHVGFVTFFILSRAFPTYHFSCWLVTCLVP